jgi:tRNA (guanine9-N1)-methyltransferase
MHHPQARKQGERERKEKLQRALESGQRIIIDLGFTDKMTGAEVRSLCQQLAYSYSANTRAGQPAHLILTSYDVSVQSWTAIECKSQ